MFANNGTGRDVNVKQQRNHIIIGDREVVCKQKKFLCFLEF